MRTLIDIPEGELDALTKISEARKISRASVIREAIKSYLERHKAKQTGDAFGLWGKRKIDGLEYQRKLRDEW
jgi:metal-responsive CopG/Arc/MetJ family transcriptional regulator